MTDQEQDDLARRMRDSIMIKESTDENWLHCRQGYKVILEEMLKQFEEAGWKLVRKTKE